MKNAPVDLENGFAAVVPGEFDFDRLVIEQFSGAVEDLLVERGLDIS